MSSPASSSAPSRIVARARHPVVVWVLVVLASVIALLSTLTLWVNRQVLGDAAWRKTSADLVRDQAVRDALSIYLVDQLYSNVDVGAQLQRQLPDSVKPLAGPVTAALRQPATQAVAFLLARPRTEQLWVEASALAHEKLVNVLENRTGYGISTGQGVVTLDLNGLVRDLGTELGLPASALDRLPAHSGVVTIMRSNQLAAVQLGVRVLHVLSVLLLVVALGLYALAVYLARGARRETLRNVGWAIVLVGLVTLVVRRVVGEYAIGALASPAYHDAATRVWLIGSAILGEIGWAAVLYGVITVVGAVLAGPTQAATRLRLWVAPVLVRRTGSAWAAVGGVYLLLVLWGGTHALRTWWGILLLGGLLAWGVETLRRQTARELAAVPAVQVSGAPAGESSPAEALERLRELHDAGILTDEEFALGKQRVLGA